MPSLTVDKFYSGMTEDDKLGVDGSYIYSANLTSGTFGGYVGLANGPTNYLDVTSLGDDLYGIYEVNNTIISFGEDGKIFKNNSSTPVYTHSSGYDIVAMFSNVDDLIFITYSGTGNNLGYHKISLSNISNSNWSSYVTEDFLTITQHPTSFLTPIKQIGNICYIGVGSKVVKITYSPVTTTYTYDIYVFPNKTITGITYSGAIIKVFQDDGIMYVWDGVSENQDEVINLDVPIRNVLSLANIDYVIGGYSSYYTEFFYLNGYTLVPIFKKSYSNRLGKTKFNISSNGALQNYITYKTGNLYIPGLFGTDRLVMKFGADINGLNKGTNIISTKSSFGYNYSTILGVYGRGLQLYILFTDSGGNIGIDAINVSEFNQDLQKYGELYSKVYDFGDNVKEKQFKELEVRAKNVNSLSKIVVKYSIDGNSFYTLGEVTEDGITYLSMDSLDLHSFRDICFKFEFDATSNPSSLTTNIEFYGFTIHYDYNK